MPQNIWTIRNNPAPNPPLGNDLNGCHIVQISTGYQLTAPNINNVLATTNSTTAPFTFSNVSYDGQTWNITVTGLPTGANGSGSWQVVSAAQDPNDGNFTAQAGAGLSEDADAASSAKA